MNEILSACGAFVWVYVLAFHRQIKFLNRKPFNCEVCLAGWFCLILSIGDYWLEIPFRMAAAMCLVIPLTYLLKKI